MSVGHFVHPPPFPFSPEEPLKTLGGIGLTSKKCKFQPQIGIFPGNNNPFSIKPTVVWVKISEKKTSIFSGLRSSYNRRESRKILQNFEVHDHWH